MRNTTLKECAHFTNGFKTNEILAFVPPTITTENVSVLYIFENKITSKNYRNKLKTPHFQKDS